MNRLSGATALVTGGAGFFGSHLTDALVDAGASVTVADDLSNGHLENLAKSLQRIEFLKVDLLRESLPELAARKFDYVFHFAANANVTASVADPRRDLEQNVLLTFSLLEALRQESPGTRFVYASSAAVYGEGLERPLREDDPCIPISPYAASKLAGEHYTKLFHSLYGLPALALRFFSTYGPRLRKQVVYDIIRKLDAAPEQLQIHGDGTQRRDFNSIGNALSAVLLVVARAEFTGEVFNVASGTALTIRALAEEICRQMGLNPVLAYTNSIRAGEAQQWSADISRLRALGYTPPEGLGDGLRSTVEWYLRNRKR